MSTSEDPQRVHEPLEGQHDHTLDEKGRVSIPAEFRQVLQLEEGDEVVITRHLNEQCLLVFRPDAWKAFMDKVDRDLSPIGNALRKVVRGAARRMKVDRLGRISVPSAVRGHAALDGKCFVVGQDQWMQIWDVEVWNRTHAPENYAELDLSSYRM